MTLTEPSLAPWFINHNSKKNSLARLFCFPFAGGDAQLFASWQKYLPDSIDVVALQTPGRRERLLENPIANLTQLVSEILDHIGPFTDKPFYFYGHSNGALVAFELARQLELKGHGNLRHLFIAARKPPLLLNRANPYHLLSDKDFILAVNAIGSMPSAMLVDKELQQLLLPTLKADFCLGETYLYEDNQYQSQKLTVGTTLFYGTRDKSATYEQMLNWQSLLSDNFQLKAIPGKHFFMQEQEDILLREINTVISDDLISGTQSN
ncbi:thioesterase II family protein [Colwellia psychrerythraea]|uniref:Thioesterase n=1 Tax=Colwellia psychrerythraea TaxID=28229 RepID=A0A099KPN3_COLPS|nr:thioesterase domain-containing protein [Colwellia psychrerythraea]KGJ91892.1 Thioesterase [Colwellia psychrerythraea]